MTSPIAHPLAEQGSTRKLSRAKALVVGLLFCASALAAAAEVEPLRDIRGLNEGWRFVQNDRLDPEAALAANGADWESVRLPHTWNAQDAATLQGRSYKRGVGWYRLEFDSPNEGVRHWLEFGAASLIADVWLNGGKLGQHKGGFAQFRFDVTDALRRGGRNVLLVRVDNTDPQREDDPTAIAPLGGDFNVSGGLYRHVALVSTRDAAHIDLGDMGGPGVYATTTSIAGGTAMVQVRSKLRSEAGEDRRYAVRASLLRADGRIAQSAEQRVTLVARGRAEVSQRLEVAKARLWQGLDDPYQYKLVVEVLRDGAPVDRVVQDFGIREMRFHPNEGFYLNGRHVRLRGVAMHQDFLGKAWGVTEREIDESMALVKEVGANAVRLGHYPFPRYALEKASEAGLVAWSETALGLGTTVDPCATHPPSLAFVENAKQQLQELIRQQYNHAAVATWSVGNETTARQNNCTPPYDNVRSLLQELHAVAKSEDPSRPTVYAEFGHPVAREGVFATEGITDIYATNRYFGWYTEPLTDLSPLLDGLHAIANRQALGVSEYGAGAAISHHSDNPLGGRPDIRSAPEGKTAYQPEEYAAHAHEENYRIFAGKPYLWGTFVWNMFDFGSAHRNEGDVLGVNTKGLVTFDRKTRKDAFFFYKANWSTEPVTYLTSRRYTDRAYAHTRVKVYSNADAVRLSLNGATLATKEARECPLAICVFKDVRLVQGENVLEVEGRHGDKRVTDSVRWSLKTDEVNIAAGWVATGFVASDGRRFGSDEFFLGGQGLIVKTKDGGKPLGPESFVALAGNQAGGTDDPPLFRHYRSGTFSYDIPLENGRYEVTLAFAEPDLTASPGQRLFDVLANGSAVLQGFDVLAVAGGSHQTAVIRSFPMQVSNGHLVLDFRPVRGEAVVSVIAIRPARP